jgi:hypothetical protein
MSDATATEIAPAKLRTPSRALRKRDERVRRIVRWLKKDATFLDKPRYAQQLRIYAGLTIKYETLLANINARYGDNLLNELGHAIPALETLQRLAKACATIGSQLGLSPGSERAMRHGLDDEASHSKWLWLANHTGNTKCGDDRCACHKDDEEVVVTPAPAASTPAPATNAAPRMPGFTAPA